MKDGGNIWDGAISALFCNSLMQLQSMGLLGGFLLTVYMKSERKSVTIDAQITAPKNFPLPIKNVDDVKQGPLAVGTPSFLKGLWEIHQKYGSISWKDLIEPTINLCNDGITITKHLHDSMHINKNIVNDPYLRELFIDKETKKFKRPGLKFTPKKQCKFLKLVANHTGSDIYSDGLVVDGLVKDLHDAGSSIKREDLREYKAKWTDSIEYKINDDDSMFLPNTAAVLIPAVINILKKYHFNASSFDSENNVNETILTHHRIVEAFKHVFALRSLLGDPDFVNVKEIMSQILTTKYSSHVNLQIDDAKSFADPKKYAANFIAPNNDGTSHISLIASNGDGIAVTSSINY